MEGTTMEAIIAMVLVVVVFIKPLVEEMFKRTASGPERSKSCAISSTNRGNHNAYSRHHNGYRRRQLPDAHVALDHHNPARQRFGRIGRSQRHRLWRDRARGLDQEEPHNFHMPGK